MHPDDSAQPINACQRSFRRSSWLLALCLAGVCLASVAVAQEAPQDEAFLSGLRQRRLFALARTYCQQRLQLADLSPARQVELTLEWSQAFAEEAAQTKPTDSAPLWQQSDQVLADFAKQNQQHPRLLLVQLQTALNALARGELLVQQAELLAQPATVLDRARGELRQAIQQLLLVQRGVVQAQQNAFSQRGNGPWTERELHALQTNVQYQLARAYRQQGISYPPNSADRSDALTQAIETLRLLVQADADEPLVWPCRIEMVRCARLQANLTQAEQYLATWKPNDTTPPASIASWYAERLRCWLAAGQVGEATRTIHALQAAGTVGTSADFDFACLEVTLAAWQQAQQQQDTAAQKAAQAQADQQVRAIQQLHGPYWARRASNLESLRIATSGGTTEDPAALARAAENLLLSGEPEAALAQYDRARQMALQRKDEIAAFDWGYTAAAIEHKRQNHTAAAQRFLALARLLPGQPRAGEAHLWGVYHTGQQLLKTPDASHDGYAQLLDEHLTRWPKDTSAIQARLWLAKLNESREQWALAAEQYAQVPADHEKAAEAVAGFERTALAHYQLLKAENKETALWSRWAAVTAEIIISGRSARLPEQWNDLQRQAVLVAAFWLSQTEPPQFEHAAEMLQAALKASPNAAPAWQATARQRLVLAWAAAGRPADAEGLLADLAAASPQDLLALLSGVNQLANASNSAATKRSFASLQLRSVQLLQPHAGQLTPGQKQALDLTYARAIAAGENSSQGLAIYLALVTKYPNDARMAQEYGLLLLAQPDRGSWQTALEIWRKLAKGSKPGTEHWFQARYQVATSFLKLGDHTMAAKFIDATRLLYPEFGGPAWQSKFKLLREQCRP